MEILHSPLHFFIFITLLSTAAELGKSVDTITLSRRMSNNKPLVSAGAKFELGFFSPRNSSNRYVRIWFYNIPVKTIVWVANRDDPINSSSGVLQIGRGENLVIIDGTGRVVWSTNTRNVTYDNVAAQLLDSGNLVLTDESNHGLGNFLWQSFDHPSDTLLACMKLGWDLRIRLNRYLTSWRDSDDPSTGDFTYLVELHGLPQKSLRKNVSVVERSRPWNGVQFSGVLMIPNAIFNPQFVTTAREVYYASQLINESTIMRIFLSHSGTLQCCLWNDNTQWTVVSELPNDSCDEYAKCRPNAVCTIRDFRICSCLTGYTPKSSEEWTMLLWSGGCIKRKPLNCPEGEEFQKLKSVKVPDMLSYWVNSSMSLNECRAKCLKNCTCTAYANSDVSRKGSGCVLWFGDLLDIRTLIESRSNQDVFIRVTASDLGNHKRKLRSLVAEVAASLSLPILLLLCFWSRTTKKRIEKLAGNRAGSSLMWRRRFDIIVGVARGLLYLHRDSRLRIIHQDLRASNVLLDSEMNPKISDFGMARAFGGDQFLEKMRRVVGTFGYISPEYAIDRIFSAKSDVFSCGVLVLEIVGGRRNREFHHHDHNLDLLGHTWKLWLQGKAIELIDKQMEDSFPMWEVMRCIQIGLLCVQRSPEQRPTMSSVLLMLDSKSTTMWQPKQRGFYTERFCDQIDSETNELTVTLVKGR